MDCSHLPPPNLAAMTARFLTRKQVAEELNITMAQCYALIRRGELRAAKIGGRGDCRIRSCPNRSCPAVHLTRRGSRGT